MTLLGTLTLLAPLIESAELSFRCMAGNASTLLLPVGATQAAGICTSTIAFVKNDSYFRWIEAA